MIEVDSRWTVDGVSWAGTRASCPDTLRTTLLLAAFELRSDKNIWVKYNAKFQKRGSGPYHWCSKGWEANNHEGYGWDVSNALRPFVPDGDLTRWWRKGRSRGEMIGLFLKAAEL